MVFTVTYRNESGRRDFLELDVPSKADVWAELKRRGVAAIAVTEGSVPPAAKGRQGPGGGGRARPSGAAVLAGCLLAALLAAVGYFFLAGGGAAGKGPKADPAAQAATASPRKPRPPAQAADPADGKALKVPEPSGRRIERREAIPEPPPLEELQAAMTNEPPRRPRPAFTNGAEQLIALATPSVPGGRVPPLPMIADEGIARELKKAMGHAIKAEEDDSEATLEKKILVAQAKEEFRELHEREGYTFSEYVNALRDQANLDADFLAEAHRMSNDLYHDETISDEDYVKYRDQINEKLAERGLPTIE